MIYVIYAVSTLVWALIWGFATRAVILNKGYEYEGTKWFWLGFFFSFIAIIIAATKPVYQRPVSHVKTEKERQQEILDNGGWKCVCGRVNCSYVSSCACGKSIREGNVKNRLRQPPKKVEEKDGAKPDAALSEAAKIREYKALLDDGIITQEEFDAKKKQLLGL